MQAQSEEKSDVAQLVRAPSLYLKTILMGYKLFLDDKREVKACLTYMHLHIGNKVAIYTEDWDVCRNFEEFRNTIISRGLPDIISFDHDLANEHYTCAGTEEEWEEYYMSEFREMTGYDCANWLIGYCAQYGKKLPEYFVHSMNPVGREKIEETLAKAKFYNS